MTDHDSDQGFHSRLNAGRESAAGELDRRYRERLCRLVERDMGRRFQQREDPEDVVQSVLRSFFRGIDQKGWRIDHSGALWALLTQIAGRKVLKHAEYMKAKLRDPDAEIPGVADIHPNRDPTPEEAAQVAELMEKALEGLAPPYPEIFRMRLEGYTESAIAENLGSTRAAVRYKLGRIRDRLGHLLDKDHSV